MTPEEMDRLEAVAKRASDMTTDSNGWVRELETFREAFGSDTALALLGELRAARGAVDLCKEAFSEMGEWCTRSNQFEPCTCIPHRALRAIAALGGAP